MAVIEAFLGGISRHRVNVHRELAALNQDALRDIKDCAGRVLWRGAWHGPQRLEATRLADDDRFTVLDGKNWLPFDPMKTREPGESAEATVRRAFDTGLYRLSIVVFDGGRRRAALVYGFECGMLCGHGGVATFRKVNGAWTPERACETWIS